jgi:hypothetical protein
VAIKGKTKRSQGRPARRVTPGPRPQLVERRVPWYRAPVFAVTMAVLVLAVTLLATVLRVQEAWQRDDVARFTTALQAPLGRLATLGGTGTKDKPGFASVSDFASGKLKPAELDRRAQNWATQIGTIREEVSKISLGEAEVRTVADGVPANQVGGRVRLLSQIRDAYTNAVTSFGAAAQSFQYGAKASGPLQQQLVQDGQQIAQAAQQSLDTAAGLLANLHARYDLDVTRQMPGESATAYGARYGGAPQPATPGLPSG